MSVATVADSLNHATDPADASRLTALDRLRMMMLIRRFEERTYQEYTKPGQRIGGFCHLYSGQEAIAVGVAAVFDKARDYLINPYRDHGHSLALGMDPKAAMAELFGKATGCSRGKGGSMHFFDAANRNLGGHGIVGGHLPLGLGAAFACWYKRTGGVCFTLLGDGAVNQGTFGESMNLASLWKLPCMFIVENNGLAMGTQVERSSAARDLVQRGASFNMPCGGCNGNDLDEVIEHVREAADRARRGDGPSYLVANTYRYRGHSMSDAMKYRTREELEKARRRDPVELYAGRLKQAGWIDEPGLEDIERQVQRIISDAVKFAEASPNPRPQQLYEDVLADRYPPPSET